MESVGLDKSSVVKKSILYIIFAIELLFLCRVITNFVENQKYFSLSPEFAVPFVLMLIPTLWTIGLISHSFTKKWEILIAPSILFILSLIFLTKFKTEEAIVSSIFSFLYFLYSIQRTKSISESLIKIKIRYSGRYATKGFLFIISAITALSVFLMSENISSINVGEWAADIVEKPVKEAVEKEYEKQVPEKITSLNIESLKESNPQVAAVLNSFGITELPTNISLPESNTESVTGTIKNSISSQINSGVEPYKKFFSPTIALLVFGILQIYNSIIYFIYTNTIFLILFLLKKIGFVDIKTIPAEKEILEL